MMGPDAARCAHLRARGGWWEDAQSSRCAWPIAPINTWSNGAYILAGIVTFALRPTGASLVMALALLYLGVGSALYHGTKRGWASKLDYQGMYVTFGALTIYAGLPEQPGTPLAMGVAGALLAWQVRDPAALHLVLGLLLGIILTFTFLGGAGLWALAGLATFGLAYGVWWMDLQRTFWLPRWGHGLWHVLTALALALVFHGRGL